MFTGYNELNELSPMVFCDPINFQTEFDTMPCNKDLHDRQYQLGLQTGRDYEVIIISAYSTWSAQSPHRFCTSCEGIGYHACTADLLRGFIDSGAPIVVYRGHDTKPFITASIISKAYPPEWFMREIVTDHVTLWSMGSGHYPKNLPSNNQ